MSNCTHCGKPAGLFRSYHAECREQFERAATTIPAFFEKLLHSLLPAERFGQLLQEVATTFHITPEQLRSLSIVGLIRMLDAILSDHVPTVAEEDRILDIAANLGLTVNDIPNFADRFLKIDILRDLDDGKIPERVTVVGLMPFELVADESIIWIFNGVRSFRGQKPNETPPPSGSPRDLPDFVPTPGQSSASARTEDAAEIGVGDLMMTSRQLFLVSEDRHRQIPFSKIEGLAVFADGFHISRTADDRPLICLLDDPWFAANLLLRLMRLPANAPVPEHEMGPLGAK